MTRKLNTQSAFLVVLFYLIFSFVTAFLVVIFSGGPHSSPNELVIDGVIGRSLITNSIVMVVLLFISFFVFKDSRRDIFFERKRFDLSKLYYLFPLASLVVPLFVFFNVDFSAYSLRVILLVIVATLVIGVNEEVVTRGITLIGLRNNKWDEWKAWVMTVVVFSLLHLVNVLGGGNLTILLIVVTGGTLWYVSRRVFNNLFVSIGLHALYDTAFFLLTGKYLVSENLPDHVLDIQLGSFLVLLVVSILFVIFGRGLLKNETTGWWEA
jgi:hypothetical protein